MSFLNSLPLWAGLAALGVSIPVLIHLWSRRQKNRIDWAAMELLKKALVARSQQVSMEDRLILILRCLALLLFAIALLRPVMNTSWSDGSAGSGIVIAIDASYSMGHGEPSRLEKALSKAREILSTVSEGEPVSIVLMSSHPRDLFRRTGYDPATFSAGLTRSARTSAFPLNIERNLEHLCELTEELKTASRKCYIITDAQTSDWQSLSDQARTMLDRLSKKARVTIAPVTSDGLENMTLTDFGFSAGSLQREGSARFSASVRNNGAQTAEGGRVSFYINNKLKAMQEVGKLEVGETGHVSFYTFFDAAGDVALAAKLSNDDLMADNHRYAIARIRTSIRVLCIDGDISHDTQDASRGAFYALRALRLKHAASKAPIQVTHIDIDGLYREKLENYDMLMMFNVAEVDPELGKHLKQFTDNGGGLLVCMGDKTDPGSYNSRFTAAGKPLLPLIMREVVKHPDAAQGWQLVSAKSNHPISRLVHQLPAAATADIRIQTAISATPRDQAEVLLQLDNGIPLLTASRNGRILVLTSSADRSWNTLPLNPLFLILLRQSTTMLTNTAKLERGIAGESATMSLPGRMMGDVVKLQTPSGKTKPVTATVIDGNTVLKFTPESPGIYRTSGGTGTPDELLAINVNPAEADIRSADTGALEKSLGDFPLSIVSGPVADAALNARTGRDVSLTMLVLAAICFFAQGLVANHLSRRKHAGGAGVARTLQHRSVAAARRS